MILKITSYIKVNKKDIQRSMKLYEFEDLEDFVSDVVSLGLVVAWLLFMIGMFLGVFIKWVKKPYN